MPVKYKNMIFIILMFILLDNAIAAQLSEDFFSIRIGKTEYYPGEEVVGTIILKNIKDQPMELILEKYIYLKDNPLMDEEPFFETITLEPYETREIRETLPVSEDLLSGDYVFEVIVTDPSGAFDRTRLEKAFKVTGTKKTLLISLKVCKQISCEYNKKVFIKNEEINLNYNSELSNPITTTILTYPDKTTKQITLPYSLKAEQLGTYELEVTASKEGYKTITKKTQFGVIEQEADIQYSEPRTESSKSYSKGILYVSIGIIILIVLFWLYKRKQ